MAVLYGGKSIIPAPFVTIDKEYQKSGDGKHIGTRFSVVLRGTLVAQKGSPDKSKNFHTASGYPADDSFTDEANQYHTSILRKQEALRELFANEGQILEFVPWDGSASVKCYPRVSGMTFEEGNWHNVSTYTVTLEADEILGLPGGEDDFLVEGENLYISEADESWSLEFNDQPQGVDLPYSFRLTHNVSATGKRHYDATGVVSEAWVQAKKWVAARLGIDNSFLHTTEALQLTGDYGAFNHTRTENTNELTGNYAVTETWLVSKTDYLEDFTVSVRTSAESSLTTVGIEGSITGLEVRSSGFGTVVQTKWDNAEEQWNSLVSGGTLLTRAQSYSGITLNTDPLTSNVSRNPVTGVISYNYEYDNRPSNCIAGARSETITIDDQNPADVFARIGVIGREKGPVLQAINTVTESKRTISIEVIMDPATGCPTNADAVEIYLAQAPTSAVNNILTAFENDLISKNTQVFVENDSVNWLPKSGRYSRTKTWVYQNC